MISRQRVVYLSRRALRGRPPSAAGTMLAHLGHRDGVTFVQIGSNDGREGDPLHDTAVARGWRGLLVEPLPDLFDRLRVTYAGVDGMRFVRAAIGPTDGEMVLYRIPDRQPDDPAWVDQLASFDRRVVMKSDVKIPGGVAHRIVEERVPCLTLATLLRTHDVTAVDLLHVDTEGYDYEVLRQVDFAAPWRPATVLFEHKHLTGSDRDAAFGLLRSEGYQLTIDTCDCFATAAGTGAT